MQEDHRRRIPAAAVAHMQAEPENVHHVGWCPQIVAFEQRPWPVGRPKPERQAGKRSRGDQDCHDGGRSLGLLPRMLHPLLHDHCRLAKDRHDFRD
jgi:hypothetical protein